MPEFALQVQNLHKVYSNEKSALDGVNLNVPNGAFYALLGPNGAGKSTLINILADIVRPSSGTAYLMGHDLFHDRAWCKRHLGVVPQEIAFDPFFNPREMLRITSGLFGCKPDSVWINELLDRLELSAHAVHQQDDTVVESRGVKLLVDAMSLDLLKGSEVDYQSSLQGESFVIHNPNAGSTCGCGQSFTPSETGSGCANAGY